MNDRRIDALSLVPPDVDLFAPYQPPPRPDNRHCVRCRCEIPPGKAGRKCKACRNKPVLSAWVSLAYEPTESTILVTGFADSREGCEPHHQRTDAAYGVSLKVDKTLSAELMKWLERCGIPSTMSRAVTHGVLDAICTSMEEEKLT